MNPYIAHNLYIIMTCQVTEAARPFPPSDLSFFHTVLSNAEVKVQDKSMPDTFLSIMVIQLICCSIKHQLLYTIIHPNDRDKP